MKTLECEDERGLTSSGRQARPCSSGHTRQQCKGTTCVTAGPASALRAAVSVLFTLCPRCLTAVICSRLITYKYVHQIMIQNMFLGKKNCFDGFCKVGGEKEEGRGKIERERKKSFTCWFTSQIPARTMWGEVKGKILARYNVFLVDARSTEGGSRSQEPEVGIKPQTHCHEMEAERQLSWTPASEQAV